MKCFASPAISAESRRLWLAAAAWLLLALTALAAGERIVDVKARVVCRGDAVQLGDLASFPEQLLPAERALVVAEAGTWENGRRVPLRTLAYLLQRHEVLMDLHLRGPEYITVVRLASQAQIDRAREAILADLRSRPPWSRWTIDVQLDAAADLQLAHAGSFDAVSVLNVDSRVALGRVAIELACTEASGQRRIVRLAPRVRRQVDSVVVARQTAAGEVLGEADLSVAQRWVEQERDVYASGVEGCLGRELTRRVEAGDLVRPADLLQPVCAQRGDQVWVTCQRGGLTVRIIALAVQPGRAGERIRLQNPQSGKLFQAELSGPRAAVFKVGF